MTTSTRPIVITLIIVWLSVLSISFFNFQPLLVGALVESSGLSESHAGYLAMTHMLGMLLGLAGLLLRAGTWTVRQVVLVSLLLLIVGDVGSAFGESYATLMGLRLVCGLGSGLILAAAVILVTSHHNPHRLFALIMLGQSLYGMIGLALLPGIIQSLGLTGAFLSFAALALLTLPFITCIPNIEGEQGGGQVQPLSTLISAPVILTFVSLVLVYVGWNGLWPYYERIGDAMAISLERIGYALSAGLLAAIAGAAVAAVLGDRFGRLGPILIGIVGAIGSIALLYVATGFREYVTSVVGLFACGAFFVPYYMAVLADADQSGRLVIIGFLCVFAGSLAGPALAANLVGSGDYTVLIIVSAIVFFVAMLVLLYAFWHMRPIALANRTDHARDSNR